MRDTARTDWQLRGAWLTTGYHRKRSIWNARVAFEAGNSYIDVGISSKGHDVEATLRALVAGGYEERGPKDHLYRWLQGPEEILREMKVWQAYGRAPSALPPFRKRRPRVAPKGRAGEIDREFLARVSRLAGWRCFAVQVERRRPLEGPWAGWSILAHSRALEDASDRFHEVGVQIHRAGSTSSPLERVVRAHPSRLRQLGLRDSRVPKALDFAQYFSPRLTAAEAVTKRRQIDRVLFVPFEREG